MIVSNLVALCVLVIIYVVGVAVYYATFRPRRYEVGLLGESPRCRICSARIQVVGATHCHECAAL